MKKYWALDYVDDTFCELVCDDRVYDTEEEATAIRESKADKENYEVVWYSLADLKEIFDGNLLAIEEGRVK